MQKKMLEREYERVVSVVESARAQGLGSWSERKKEDVVVKKEVVTVIQLSAIGVSAN